MKWAASFEGAPGLFELHIGLESNYRYDISATDDSLVVGDHRVLFFCSKKSFTYSAAQRRARSRMYMANVCLVVMRKKGATTNFLANRPPLIETGSQILHLKRDVRPSVYHAALIGNGVSWMARPLVYISISG